MKQEIFTAVIIDDEKDSIEVLQSHLDNFNEINVIETADNGIDGEYLLSKHQPDLAFVDIDMPGKNGVDLLRDMHNVHNNIKVIFTTAYEKYAIESIKYHPFGYLLKPVGLSQLKEVICHVKNDEKHFEGRNSNKLKVSSKQEVRFIDYDDILYLEADGNYTKIFLINSDIINVTLQIGKIEEQLSENMFLRVNRSVSVNVNFIKLYKRKERKVIIENNKNLIPVTISGNISHILEKLLA